MKLHALAAVIGLLGACVQDPDDHKPKVEEVTPAAFHSVAFHVVDDGSTYMQELLRRVPIERPPGIKAEVESWRVDGAPAIRDVYLTAPAPDVITRYVGPTVPSDRVVALEQLGPHEWRTYLLVRPGELDRAAIASAKLDPNARARP